MSAESKQDDLPSDVKCATIKEDEKTSAADSTQSGANEDDERQDSSAFKVVLSNKRIKLSRHGPPPKGEGEQVPPWMAMDSDEEEGANRAVGTSERPLAGQIFEPTRDAKARRRPVVRRKIFRKKKSGQVKSSGPSSEIKVLTGASTEPRQDDDKSDAEASTTEALKQLDLDSNP